MSAAGMMANRSAMLSGSNLNGRSVVSAPVRAQPRRSQVQARAQTYGPASLPDLPYDFSALEPYISGEIMELHHSRHHNTYVTNLNATLEKYAAAEKAQDLAQMIALEPALKFNGGGHVNHSHFWQNLIPNKDFKPPSGELSSLIDKDFGSLDTLKTKFNAACAGIQGSGWGWLAYNKDQGRLIVTTTANQDPISIQGLVPIVGIDMWEHAYYLQYKNKKPDYLGAVWDVMNWDFAAQKLAAAK